MTCRRSLVVAALAGALGCGKKAHDAPVAPPAVDDARALDAAAAPAPLPAEAQAKRFEECWGYYNAGRWDQYKACHAPGATFDKRGLDNWYLDVDTKVSDLKRLGVVAPGDHAAIEWALATEGGVVAIVRVTGTEAGKPVELRIGETVWFDDRGRIKEDFLYFDAASKTSPTAPPPVPNVVIPDYTVEAKENYVVAERLVDAWSSQNPDNIGALLAEDATWTDHGLQQVFDKPEFLAYVRDWRNQHPQYYIELRHGSFGGDYVAMTGDLKGEIGEEYKKRIGAKPTVNGLTIPVLAVFRVANGKVASAELFWQSAAQRAQLGLAPAP